MLQRIALFLFTTYTLLFGRNDTYFQSPDTAENLLKKAHPPLEGNLTLSADANFIALHAFHSNSNDTNSRASAWRFYGEWAFDALAGKLIFKTEYRDSFGGIAPTDFGFNLGYVGMLHSTFSDQQLRLTTLYWKQYLFEGDALLLVGFLDVTEYVDVYMLASPWESFSNLVFATGSGTIGGLPDGAPGVMLGGWLDDHWYLSAGTATADADAADPIDSLDTLFSQTKLFSSIEIGYVPSKEALFSDNTHLTLWYMDGHGTTPHGWGVSASWTQTIGKQSFVFIRGGWSEGGGALLKRSLSIGGAYLTASGNVLGIGINAGKPNDESFPGAVHTQYTTELFYRWQLTKHLQLTPSFQYVRRPAADTSTSYLCIPALRLRASF